GYGHFPSPLTKRADALFALPALLRTGPILLHGTRQSLNSNALCVHSEKPDGLTATCAMASTSSLPQTQTSPRRAVIMRGVPQDRLRPGAEPLPPPGATRPGRR